MPRFIDPRDESLQSELTANDVVNLATFDRLVLDDRESLVDAICRAPGVIDTTRWLLWQVRNHNFTRVHSVNVDRKWIVDTRFSQEQHFAFHDALAFPIWEHEDAFGVVAFRPPSVEGGIDLAKMKVLLRKGIILVATTPAEFGAIRNTYQSL